MSTELTPEQYRELQASSQTQNVTLPVKYLGLVVVGILIVVASFIAGVQYQKGKQSTTDTASQANSFAGGGNTFQGGPGGGRMMSGAAGSVTAVSDSGITITDVRSGNSSTFTITSDTKVLNNGATASVADIKAGSTVIIEASETSQTQASQIILNPRRMMGPNSSSSTQQDGANATSDSSTL